MKIKLLVFFLLLYNSSFAQNPKEASALTLGVNAQYSFVQSKANFSALPGVPRPNLSTNDFNSNSYNISAFADYNFGEWLSLGLNFSYMPIVSNFENFENSIIGIDGVPTPIQFKHQLDTKLDYFSVFPYFKFNIWNLANLRLGSRLFF